LEIAPIELNKPDLYALWKQDRIWDRATPNLDETKRREFQQNKSRTTRTCLRLENFARQSSTPAVLPTNLMTREENNHQYAAI
jgi:hypothetical protein